MEHARTKQGNFILIDLTPAQEHYLNGVVSAATEKAFEATPLITQLLYASYAAEKDSSVAENGFKIYTRNKQVETCYNLNELAKSIGSTAILGSIHHNQSHAEKARDFAGNFGEIERHLKNSQGSIDNALEMENYLDRNAPHWRNQPVYFPQEIINYTPETGAFAGRGLKNPKHKIEAYVNKFIETFLQKLVEEIKEVRPLKLKLEELGVDFENLSFSALQHRISPGSAQLGA